MIRNFRGFIVAASRPSSTEPYFNGSEFSVKEIVVPTSVDYKVDDLLALGKVTPVDTQILHDNDAVDNLINSSNIEPSNIVEPSND